MLLKQADRKTAIEPFFVIIKPVHITGKTQRIFMSPERFTSTTELATELFSRYKSVMIHVALGILKYRQLLRIQLWTR